MAENKADYQETRKVAADLTDLTKWGSRVTFEPDGVTPADFFTLYSELQTALVTNPIVIGKLLTGYASGAGTVAATDTILQAFQKLNGNIAAINDLKSQATAAATERTGQAKRLRSTAVASAFSYWQ